MTSGQATVVQINNDKSCWIGPFINVMITTQMSLSSCGYFPHAHNHRVAETRALENLKLITSYKILVKNSSKIPR